MSDSREGEIRAEIKIQNEEGLHARPAALIVQALQKLECQVYLSKKGEAEEVDAKSILGVMMLAAERGAKMNVRATGPEAQSAVKAIKKILSDSTGGKS